MNHEVERYPGELKNLRSQLSEANVVIGFYGKKENWTHDGEMGADKEIFIPELHDLENEDGPIRVAGRCARLYMNNHGLN
jgi:hypothetical protein